MSMQPVLHSFSYCLGFLREQISDVEDREMSTQPGTIVGHPAWIIGHITFTCQMLGGVIGLDPWLPAEWEARFGPGSRPESNRELFGSKDELVRELSEAEKRITSAVNGLKVSEMNAPFPDKSFLEVFPTVRHALTQVLVGHTANHIGQVSVWRRAMGLPPMARSFE